MALVMMRRACAWDYAGVITWQDDGPGDFAVSGTNGTYTVTLPTFMIEGQYSVLCHARGKSDTAESTYMVWPVVHSVTTSTVQVELYYYSNNTASSEDITLEICFQTDDELVGLGLIQRGKFPVGSTASVADEIDGVLWEFDNGTSVPGPNAVAGGGIEMSALVNSCHRDRAAMPNTFQDPHSISFWFKANLVNNEVKIGSGTHVADDGYSAHSITINTGGILIEVCEGSGTDTSAARRSVLWTPTADFIDDAWHHLAFTCSIVDGTISNYKCYVDNVDQGAASSITGTGTYVNWLSTAVCQFQMNSEKGANNGYYAWGALADYRTYSRVLTAGEVASIAAGAG